MSYETPVFEVVAVSVNTAVANEIELDFSTLISKDITA